MDGPRADALSASSRVVAPSANKSPPTKSYTKTVLQYTQYMVQAHVVVDLAGTAVIVAALYTVCCMLLTRAAAKAPKQSPVAAIALTHRPHPRTLLPPSPDSSCGRSDFHSPVRSRTTTSMLRNAVDAHELKAAKRPDTIDSVAQQNKNPGYRNPLAPSSSALLNGGEKHAQLRGTGIKRTSSGIAKVASGVFEDDLPGSQNRPIAIGASPAKAPVPVFSQADIFWDENDFADDDDLDLSIVEPRAHTAIQYPKLPAPPPSQTPSFVSGLKQTQPRQQQVSSHFGRVPDSSLERSPANGPPGSSAPLPWSSSPIGHHEAKAPSIRSFAFQQQRAPSIRPQQQQEARAVKRRTLPWQNDEGENDQIAARDITATTNTARIPLKRPTAPMSTPLSKKSAASKTPWNTTASAMKEQQRKHREETKKAPKHVEGTEESIRAAKSSSTRPAKVFLSDEQRHVLDLVSNKKSVFFTGSAGTGKSVLLREIIVTLRRVYAREPDRVAVTASTGLAACNIGGITLHSFSGIGLGKEDVSTLVRKIKKNQKAKNRWMRTKVLVIDEVSMVDGELFDKLEQIARQIRNNSRPFGGIQLVITGDFFQLPPVPENNRVAKFAFDAATWSTSIQHTIGLHHVFRQKDPKFAGMLNEMREGRLTEASIAEFRKLSRPLPEEDQLVATELFPTRNEVERANGERLGLLQGKTFSFAARDGGTIEDKTHRDKLLSNCLAPENITLKKGAQVMLIKNIDESLVNGSIGRVLSFMDERQFDLYTLQGSSSDLSTTPGEDSELNARELMMDHVSTGHKWPLVRFTLADGTHRDLLCQAEVWKIELPTGEVQASRTQVPLILAWALSIHKAQGQTLERVKVDLGKVFEKGQAYVALSRATRMEGLQVLRFDPKKVNAHEKVRVFYAALSRVEQGEQSKQSKETKNAGQATIGYEAEFLNGDHHGWGNDA